MYPHSQARVFLGALAIALLALVALPDRTSAQQWLADRDRTEGPGFRVGDFELHPGVGVEVGYDSNLYFTSDDTTLTGAYIDSAILRATAHLLISTRGAQRSEEGEAGGSDENESAPTVTFRGGVNGSFYHFFNDNARTNMDVDASMRLGVLPGRPFGFTLTNVFERSIRPFTERIGNTSFARISNVGGLDLNFASSGEVFKVTAGYRNRLDFFEDSTFQWGNRMQNVARLTETFRFLPQTALVHNTQFTHVTLLGPSAGAASLMNAGSMLQTSIGVNGAFSSEFSVLASVGYGASFFDAPAGLAYDADYESLIAQLEARWQISAATRLVAGYDRGFSPSFIGNYYRRDRGSVQFQTTVGGAFLLGIDASFSFFEFGPLIGPTGNMIGTTTNREDYRVMGTLFGEYRFTNWLALNATVRYTGNITDFRWIVGTTGGTTTFLDPADFNKVECWMGLRAFY